MSSTEIIAALLGLINVALIVRRNIWNYPFGLLMVLLYFWVFWQAHLYSDAALQVFFFAVQIYGWRRWAMSPASDGLVAVERLSPAQRLQWIAGVALLTVAEGFYLATYTDDVAPWLDASTTALSLAAQYLLAVRKIENWLLWIVADVVQIALYYAKGLYPTAALYLVFLLTALQDCANGRAPWRMTKR